MRTRHFLSALSVLLGGALIGSFAGEAQAGGCWDGCVTNEPNPPIIHRTFKHRIQVEQGVYEIAREPALYGWVVPGDPTAKGAAYADDGRYGTPGRRVLIKPYRNIAIYHRAKHIYPTERVAIQPEPYGTGDWWDRLFD